MRRERLVARREKLVGRLPVTGEILRGSLLERIIRNHARGCAKCASGEGHPLSVLTVSYPGGRTRQFSLRGEMVPVVRRWLANYQELKQAIEVICELNHELLRPDESAAERGQSAMIEMRRAQLSFGDGLIAGEVKDLPESWMNHADRLLDDENIVATVYEALGRRHPKSRRRGRRGAPAEVVLRLLILKHVRNWSYAVLEREVRANLVYREFTRVGAGKMPDAKTMGRWGVAMGPEVIQRLHERLVAIAQAEGIAPGRRMRVDTTVVETNIHYPTDTSLLGDGVRVLTRTMKKITEFTGEVGARLRDRSRSVKLRLLEIARAARAKGPQSQERSSSLRQTAELDRPGGRPGEAIRSGDRRRRQTGGRRGGATRARRPASTTR